MADRIDRYNIEYHADSNIAKHPPYRERVDNSLRHVDETIQLSGVQKLLQQAPGAYVFIPTNTEGSLFQSVHLWAFVHE